jgi:hypothetical protein
MHAHITAYKGRLVLELLAKASIPDEVATSLDNPGNIGQVIMNTGKNLGVSAEALELLKQVKRGHDDIGDIDWFRTGDTAAFGWLGGIYRIADPKQVEGSRTYGIFDYVAIPNHVPQGAMQAIDSSNNED